MTGGGGGWRGGCGVGKAGVHSEGVHFFYSGIKALDEGTHTLNRE